MLSWCNKSFARKILYIHRYSHSVENWLVEYLHEAMKKNRFQNLRQNGFRNEAFAWFTSAYSGKTFKQLFKGTVKEKWNEV